jgi:hypothetical protein
MYFFVAYGGGRYDYCGYIVFNKKVLMLAIG